MLDDNVSLKLWKKLITMSNKLASIQIRITADGASAEAVLKSLKRGLDDFEKSAKKIGSAMSKYVTGPLVALSAVSVNAANTQLQAEARLLTALRGREDVQQRLIAQAAELQQRTLFGDEELIAQQAYLATLNLTEEQISATLAAAVQLSAAMGMELDAAVKNLAKTYGGLAGELGESIPAFRELSAEQMRAGAAIEYVNENYQGFAETAARTGAGPLVQLKNKFGDLAEKIGVVLLPVLNQLTELLSSVADYLATLSPETMETIVTIGAIVAAIGPLLLGLSKLIGIVNALGPAIRVMGQALVWLSAHPIVALLTAVSALIVKLTTAETRLERIARLQDDARAAGDIAELEAYNEYYNSRESLEDLKRRFQDEMRRHNAWMINNGEVILPESLSVLWGEDAIESHLREREEIIGRLEGLHRAIVDREAQAQETADIEALIAGISSATDVAEELDVTFEGVSTEVERATGIIGTLQEELQRIEDARPFATTLEDIESLNTQADKLRQEIDRLNSYSGEGVIKSLSPIRADGAGLVGSVSGPVVGDLVGIGAMRLFMEFRARAMETAEKIKGVIDEMNAVVSEAFAGLAITIGEGIGSMLAGESFDWANKLLSAIGDMLKQLGSALIAYATALEAFKKAFKNPWVALAAGIAAVAAGTAIKAIANKPMKLATGGLAYGPTLAVVGDNPGATSDPEVVAPLSKLRNYIGGQKLELVGDIAFELHGDMMRAVLNRDNIRLATLG